MTKLSAWRMGHGLLLVLIVAVIAAPAQTFKKLFDFDQTSGARPTFTSFAQGPDGNFYGTTSLGPNNVGGLGGSVFKITPQGKLATLYKFCSQPKCTDGATPYAGLALATDGNFYGTTTYGGANNDNSYGYGTVFRMTPNGSLTTLYSFCQSQSNNCNDGMFPYAGVVEATNGYFYGTTGEGGLYCYEGGCGTVFKITSAGNLTTLQSFGPIGGANPGTNLIQATDGNLYGTTGGGIDYFYYGTVFRTTLTGELTAVHVFNGLDGIGPSGPVMEGSDGNLYGTTGGSPPLGILGTVYQLTPKGRLTILYSFCKQPNCADGSSPTGGLIQAADGNFYGITSSGGLDPAICNFFGTIGCGTIFRLTPQGTLTTLHSLDLDEGQFPTSFFQSTNGIFYGTTSLGGTYGFGTVFSLDVGLGPFVTFVRAAGKVGQTGGILGQGFTGTTSVMLNGVPANFSIVSDTFIKATVPPGATTGYVTVTTPSGTLTSNVPFNVLN
jgi:uncharacterized repeat protein (TIGR03803 family)